MPGAVGRRICCPRRSDRLLGEWGLPKDSPEGRQRLEEALAARRGGEEAGIAKCDRRMSSNSTLEVRKSRLVPFDIRHLEFALAQAAQTAEEMAEQIIAEELKRRWWKEAELRTWPRGDAEKVALAARLRAETTTCLPAGM